MEKLPRQCGRRIAPKALVYRLGPLIALAVIGYLILRGMNTRDLASWPVFEGIRCRECGGPASVNPDQRERWGCRQCGFTTLERRRHFRLAGLSEFGSREEWLAARQEALLVSPASDWMDQ